MSVINYSLIILSVKYTKIYWD